MRSPQASGPVSLGLFAVLVVLYLGMRLFLLGAAGYEVDVNQYKEWALGGGLMGLPGIYENTSADYPPASLGVFWLVGKAFVLSQPPFAPGEISVEVVPTWSIRLPHLVFDLLLGFLLYRVVAFGGLWGTRRQGPGWGRLAALVYWWNPAVLFGSAWWGQFDSMHAFLAVAAIAALGGDRWILSAAALSAAGLSKPLAAPLVPILVVAAALRRGLPGVAMAGVSGFLVAVVLFAPFWLTGRGVAALQRVLVDVDIMPFTSLNAHNLWWWVGAWQPANAPGFGGLTPRDWGVGIFLLVAGFLLVRSRGWLRQAPEAEYRAGLFVLAAALISAFFFFSTHMHENHLFLAVPLLVAVSGRSRRLASLAIGASICVFVNEFLHDPVLLLEFPGWLTAPSGEVVPGLRGPYSSLQVWGSRLNAGLAAVVFVGTALEVWGWSRTDSRAASSGF